MGVYTLLYMQGSYLKLNSGSMDGGDEMMMGQRERERQNRERDYLADHVSSRSTPWQRKCCVAMAICLFTHPRVMGQGSISAVSVVQEAVEIRALISQC